MASASVLKWFPEALYYSALNVVVRQYKNVRHELRIFPPSVQFDVLYKVNVAFPIPCPCPAPPASPLTSSTHSSPLAPHPIVHAAPVKHSHTYPATTRVAVCTLFTTFRKKNLLSCKWIP